MSVKTTISDAGVVESGGTGTEVQNTLSTGGTSSFKFFPTSPVQALSTSSGSVAYPGVYTISSSISAGPIQVTMPLASSVPGGVFVFRNLSNDANFLSGSAEAHGTKVFKAPITGSTVAPGQQDQGAKLALSPIIGASVSLISDGKSFCVLAGSGSLTFSTPTA